MFGEHQIGDTKTRTWIIAHHGYQRPWKEGWQSGSCFGARWRPYEVASDALPPAIESIKAFVTSQKKRYKEFTTNPPAELPYNKGWSHKPDWIKLPRPADFSFEQNEEHSHRSGSYESEHKGTTYTIRKSIEQSERDLTRLQKRLADWKPPQK